MSSFFLFAFIPATIFLVRMITLHYFKSLKKQSKLPPGSTGWSIIGESVAFGMNPEKFMLDRMAKHSSNVFRTTIGGENVAVLCGPLGNKFIFSNEHKLFKFWWPKAISHSLLFELSKTSPMYEDHSFLKLDSMQNYVSIMDSTARDHLERHWVPYKEVKVNPLAKEFTFALACRLFLNYYDDKEMCDLTEPFFAVAKGVFSAPVKIPGTPFYGAVKAAAIIKKKLVEIIRRRKSELAGGVGVDGVQAQDLLSRLLLSSGEMNMFLSDKEIANKIMAYLFGGFYTTSTTITFVLKHLAEHPHVYNEVLKEQLEIARSKEAEELLTWGDIQKMKYSWNVVCESMRLESPSVGFLKEVIKDFTFAGYNIPKGWKVMWTTHSTNKNPKYFPDPEKFDPSRFVGNGPQPFTYVPFGGGPRMCAGQEYARIEVMVFIRNVVTRFKLKKVNPNEKITYNPEPTLVEGLPMYLQPLEK